MQPHTSTLDALQFLIATSDRDMAKHYIPFEQLDLDNVTFAVGADRQGRTTISMTYGVAGGEVSMVTCPAVTMWPRCTGDGNFGTMWGPADVTKAKFTLDITDGLINEKENEAFKMFMGKMEELDNRLLDFVTEHQLKILGRKNLVKDEVKMLQIRSIRPKYDKITGGLTGHSINLSTSKFAWDGMGGKYARRITVCDHRGATIPSGQVCPGDVVAATIYGNQVYTGVGGDKFGIHWAFNDVSVICQRANLELKTEVHAFQGAEWGFSRAYVDNVSELTGGTYDASSQFGAVASTS